MLLPMINTVYFHTIHIIIIIITIIICSCIVQAVTGLIVAL